MVLNIGLGPLKWVVSLVPLFKDKATTGYL